MTLTQSGSQVSGAYSHSQGSLSGNVSGGVLRFRWHQQGNGNKGSGRFTPDPQVGQLTISKWSKPGFHNQQEVQSEHIPS